MLASKRRNELRSRSKWMSCFVGLADLTVFEIDFTPQSDGLEILTKASSVPSCVLSRIIVSSTDARFMSEPKI